MYIIMIYDNLTSTAKELIENAYWNLGGTASYTASSNGLASHFYIYERGITVPSGNSTYWIGKIGLMYPSDYGYATSGGTTISRTSCLTKELYGWSNYSYNDCYNNNYLYKLDTFQWTITSNSSGSDSVFSVGSYVFGDFNSVSNIQAYFPVLYLKSSVYITGGTGTSLNPYTLG